MNMIAILAAAAGIHDAVRHVSYVCPAANLNYVSVDVNVSYASLAANR